MFAVSLPETSDFGKNQDPSMVKLMHVVLLDANMQKLCQRK